MLFAAAVLLTLAGEYYLGSGVHAEWLETALFGTSPGIEPDAASYPSDGAMVLLDEGEVHVKAGDIGQDAKLFLGDVPHSPRDPLARPGAFTWRGVTLAPLVPDRAVTLDVN